MYCKLCSKQVKKNCKGFCLTCYNRQHKQKLKELGVWGKHRGNRTAQSQRYRDKYSFKNNANQALYRAMCKNTIKKPDTCEICHKKTDKEREISGHHIDYSKRLEVVWVCQNCHNKLHNRKGGLNGENAISSYYHA